MKRSLFDPVFTTMSHKGVEVKPGYVYRIRNRASPHLLLELQDGTTYRKGKSDKTAYYT